MATHVLTDTQLLVGGYDLSGYSNTSTVTLQIDTVDVTTFGSSGNRAFLAGLTGVSFDVSGFWDTDATPDTVGYTNAGTSQITTLSPEGGADGDTAWLFRHVTATYSLGGQVGDVHPFTVNGTGTGPWSAGKILLPTTALSASSTGTAYQLGDVASGERVMAALHVTAATGSPTLDVIVRSDNAEGMSSPTTVLTFTQATGVTSEWQSSTAVTTDDWWQVSYTFGGTGTITATVAVGIK